jgi:hypothetical protein
MCSTSQAQWLTPVISATQRSGGPWFEASQRQVVQKTLSRKNPIQNRTDRVAQVVECLPSKLNKHEPLSSSPSTAKKKKKMCSTISTVIYRIPTNYLSTSNNQVFCPVHPSLGRGQWIARGSLEKCDWGWRVHCPLIWLASWCQLWTVH